MLLVVAGLNGYGQQITKEDYKKIKSIIPAGCKVVPDYIEGVVWVKTHKMSFMEAKDRIHEFYFGVWKNADGTFKTGPIRYKYEYNSSGWLFIDSMLVLVAESNNATRRGEGTRYMINFEGPDREIISGGITESFDIVDSDVVKWLSEIATTGHFSRFRIYGSKGYIDDTLRGTDIKGGANNITEAHKRLADYKP